MSGSELHTHHRFHFQCLRKVYRDGDLLPERKIEAHPNAYAIKCKFSPNSESAAISSVHFLGGTLFNRYLCTTSSDKTAKLWSVDEEYKLDQTFTAHTAWVWDCAFSGDSKYLVTGTLLHDTRFCMLAHSFVLAVSSDHTGCIWDTDGGEIKGELKGHQKAITAVALLDV